MSSGSAFRRDGCGLIEVFQERGRNVRRDFDLYAHHGHTLDSLVRQLYEDGLFYTAAVPKFPRSKLYSMLRDRSYIGEVFHQGSGIPASMNRSSTAARSIECRCCSATRFIRATS